MTKIRTTMDQKRDIVIDFLSDYTNYIALMDYFSQKKNREMFLCYDEKNEALECLQETEVGRKDLIWDYTPQQYKKEVEEEDKAEKEFYGDDKKYKEWDGDDPSEDIEDGDYWEDESDD